MLFGATELFRMPDAKGRIAHSEIRIGDSVVMLADTQPTTTCKSPRSLGGSSVGLMIYLENVDTVFARAIKAGGKSLRPVTNQFYGDRSGTLEDPFGHVWTVATHVEDVAPDELEWRAQAAMKKPAGDHAA
ncbi:MAG: VOC family protein [Steroidobacteraceae bacterium]